MPDGMDQSGPKRGSIVPLRLRGVMSKLSTRLTLAIVAMVIFTAVAIELVTYRGIEIASFPRAIEGIDRQVRLLAAGLENYVDGARADVKSFRAAAALAGIVRSRRNGGRDPVDATTETVWRARMANRFVAELQAKPAYLQFRIIGIHNDGRDLVRVDRSGPGNTVRIVPDDQLQQKGAPDYVDETMALGAGQIFLSPIDLNRENGAVEPSHTPVVRIATPIYADNGAAFGLLMLNLDMRPIFAQIRAANPRGGDIYLVNQRGDYLLNPDRSKEFGFDLGKPSRIQDDYPDYASLVGANGVWSDAGSSEHGERFAAAAAVLKLGPGASVSVVEIVPHATIMAPIRAIRYASLLAAFAAAVGAVVMAVLLARSLTRPLREMTAAVQAFGRNEPMRLPASAAGEIGVLVQAFKKLVDDIKSRSAALAGYAKREELYAAAVQSSNLGFLTTNTFGIITGWNPGSERLFGYSAEEAIGRGVEMLVPPERRDEIAMIREKCRTGERIDNFATIRVGKGGKPIHVLFDISPLHAPTGELVGSSGIMRDVTEQRLAEELFELAVEACPTGMMMVDRGGRIVMVNSEVEHLFGYRRDELMGQPVEMLVPIDMRAGHKKLRSDFSKRPQSRKTGMGRDLMGMRKDGSEFALEIELNPIHIREGLLILAVVVDISERKRAERLKDEFVSTVSHELRTPLTSITAALALLTAGGAGRLPEPAARLVQIAHNNGQRLVRLVNDILDIEKIESGKMTFDLKPVDARAIIEQVIEANRAYADDFGVRVRFDADSVAGEVRADADRLAQVITNLLSNAIKFSPRGEEVVVAVARREGAIRITVRDHGPGIADEFKPRVFDKFAQADASDTRQKGGTGLGLSIVEQIVNRMGGVVGFDSAVGHGTLFYVELPSWRADVDAQLHVATRALDVLLCEDDDDLAAALGAKLAKAGFSVTIVTSVSEALREADSVGFAAVLVDLRLPAGDGIGLIQKLRQMPRYHDTPIIVVSADAARAREDVRAAALDILDWLDKPVDIARLLRVLDRPNLRSGSGTPRILHIDEDAQVRSVVAEAMRRSVQVISVASIEDARRALLTKSFDIAVLDVAIAAGSGPELLAELCNIDGQAIPVVLLSAQGSNTAYADRVRAALAKSRSSIDSLIAILHRRLGMTEKPESVEQHGIAHDGAPMAGERSSNDQEVA
jgi:PAS domain S-box-containing protein